MAIGKIVEGYTVPVVNERAMRAAAGILFLFGGILFMHAVLENNPEYMKPFGFLFMADMMIRVSLSEKWAPSVILGNLFVRRQKAEWIGAPQKEFAWWLGLLLSIAACLSMGFLTAPSILTLSLCGICMLLLFLETAFGICVGCTLYQIFSKKQPQHCPGGTCEVS